MSFFFRTRALILISLWVTLLSHGQVVEQRLKSFGFPDLSGRDCQAGLIAGHDGNLYGVTRGGGVYNQGAVFKVSPDGTNAAILHSFSSTNGIQPEVTLCQDRDGSLYGSTSAGALGYGTLFKINTNGTGFRVLHAFGDGDLDGRVPRSVIQGADGGIYGTTLRGGDSNSGILYRIDAEGSNYLILFSFGPSASAGYPSGRLVQSSDGTLYGTTTSGGGTNSNGTVFKVATNGAGFAVLHGFNGFRNGMHPVAGLLLASDGWLYGTTGQGGNYGTGSMFKLQTNGAGFAMIYSFGGVFGTQPLNPLLEGSDGALYGTTTEGYLASEGGTLKFGYGVVFKINPDGTEYRVLHTFGTNLLDGSRPNCELFKAGNGELYGTTERGGTASLGTIFRINEDGTDYAIVRRFSVGGGDALRPLGPLLVDGMGMLYGATSQGGLANSGTVFKLGIDGKSYAVIHNFGLTSDSPASPAVGLTWGGQGALYGASGYGGSNKVGAIYRLNTDGTGFTVLHTFKTNSIDGQQCFSGLLRANDGTLYGTTSAGGSNGLGTVFRLDANGGNYAIIRHFSAGIETPKKPFDKLFQGTDGRLYGVTEKGGTNDTGTFFRMDTSGANLVVLRSLSTDLDDVLYLCATPFIPSNDGDFVTISRSFGYSRGKVFKIKSEDGSISILHDFEEETPFVQAPLLRGSDDALYGMTVGSDMDNGFLYRLDEDGLDYQVIHNFGFWNGSAAALTEGPDGALYGVSPGGGDEGYGTVYRLAIPPRLQIKKAANNSLNLSLRSLGPLECGLEVSTNLVDWITLTNFSASDGRMEFQDLRAGDFPRRFYRTVAR